MGRKYIDIIGHKFGNLTVIGRVTKVHGEVVWECVCDCGKFRKVRSSRLRDGTTSHCGCLGNKRPKLGTYSKNELGKRYGHLVVIRRLENRHKISDDGFHRVESMWECQCDCGNIISVLGRGLRAGTNSCGCRGYTPDESAFNGMYGRMKGSAKSRGYVWQLTKDEVRMLTSSNCKYCGVSPSQVSTKRGKSRSSYLYNGIDRVDNSIGYIPGNVVPCCWRCNSAKNSLTISEFRDWIVCVHHNLIGSN